MFNADSSINKNESTCNIEKSQRTFWDGFITTFRAKELKFFSHGIIKSYFGKHKRIETIAPWLYYT
jgi:hypothetical protein